MARFDESREESFNPGKTNPAGPSVKKTPPSQSEMDGDGVLENWRGKNHKLVRGTKKKNRSAHLGKVWG